MIFCKKLLLLLCILAYWLLTQKEQFFVVSEQGSMICTGIQYPIFLNNLWTKCYRHNKRWTNVSKQRIFSTDYLYALSSLVGIARASHISCNCFAPCTQLGDACSLQNGWISTDLKTALARALVLENFPEILFPKFPVLSKHGKSHLVPCMSDVLADGSFGPPLCDIFAD